MFQDRFADQLNIMSKPMLPLSLGQRWFLKSLMLLAGHLVQIEGLDQAFIARDPIIFAFNHNCSYETILVPAYLIALRGGRKISFIADWMFGHFPLIGWVLKQIDPIYVFNKKSNFLFLNHYRSSARRDLRNHPLKIYQHCIKRLHDGGSIGIFPEGARNRNPKALLKGKKGIGYIALASQAPVIPVGIDFPNRIRRGKIPKFGQVIIRFGSAVNFYEESIAYHQINHSPYIHPDIKRKISDYLCDKVTYRIMKEISRLSGKQYPFQEPIPPVAMKRFLFDPAFETSGEICQSQ